MIEPGGINIPGNIKHGNIKGIKYESDRIGRKTECSP